MFSAVQCSAVHCIAASYTTVNFNSVQGSALHYTYEHITTIRTLIYTKVLLAAILLKHQYI